MVEAAITGTPDGGQVEGLGLLGRFCSFYWSCIWQAEFGELGSIDIGAETTVVEYAKALGGLSPK